MLLLSFYAMAMLAIAGVIVDRWFGEPRARASARRFGKLATRLEARMNTGFRARPTGMLAWLARGRAAGRDRVAGWSRVLPFALACVVHVALLWFALGARSLRDHIAPIARALGFGDLAAARTLTARIVSRETADADEGALSRAAVESALENGNDAIFGALFWFAIAGGPGALGVSPRQHARCDVGLPHAALSALRLGGRALRRRAQLRFPRASRPRATRCSATRAPRGTAGATQAPLVGQPERGAGDGVGRGQPERADRRPGGL